MDLNEFDWDLKGFTGNAMGFDRISMGLGFCWI